MRLKAYLSIGITLLVSACGGGGGSSGDCDTPLTVAYVENEFNTKDNFVLGGFTASNTTLVHQDGDQGNTFDIKDIILSKTSHDHGNSLALSYSIQGTSTPPDDTFVAFYIDTDKNASTGQAIDGIGADVLILDDAEVLQVSLPLGVFFTGYHVWNDSTMQWEPQSSPMGGITSTASYLYGCSLNLAVYAPVYTGMDSLYGRPASGVMKLMRLSAGDPDSPIAELDSTTVFDFTVPGP
ncbi:MAG TPA: hypothetical protein ENI97_06260 [Gammaproteobacteria bacterium]|nr:hypothetical protein [Gammaproteobacteria bacterium]